LSLRKNSLGASSDESEIMPLYDPDRDLAEALVAGDAMPDVLSPRSALQQKQIGEYNLKVQKRKELVDKLGKGDEYKLQKLINLEKANAGKMATIQEYDYWMPQQKVEDVSTTGSEASSGAKIQVAEQDKIATDFWATHDYDEDFGAHNRSSMNLKKEHEDQMKLVSRPTGAQDKRIDVPGMIGGVSAGAAIGLRRIPSAQEVEKKMKLVDMALAQNRESFFVDTSYESYDVKADDFWASHDYDEDFGQHAKMEKNIVDMKNAHDVLLNVDQREVVAAEYMSKYAEKSEVEKVRAHDTWAYFRVTKDEMADALKMDAWAHLDYDDDFASMENLVSGKISASALKAEWMQHYAEKSDEEKIRAHETWAYFRITKDEMKDAEIKPNDKWAHLDYDDDFASLAALKVN